MGELRCLTEQAPYGSFIATGRKTIETRSWSTKHRGRLGIHQGKAWALGWRGWLDADDWRINALDGIGADLNEDINGSGYFRADRYTLPLGAIVATAELVDCVPIVEATWELAEADPFPCVVAANSDLYPLTLYHPSNPDGLVAYGVSVDDQRPLGDFTPGRWAWLLDDIQPTTERCPACWGTGKAYEESTGLLIVCLCGDAGHCPPVSARGKQGLWSWTAGASS